MEHALEDLGFTEALSLLSSHTSDTAILLRVLAKQLSDTLGDRVSIERPGRFGRAANQVSTITIELQPETFVVGQARNGLECSIAIASGGVTIRTERPDIAQWIERLTMALQRAASASEATRTALEHLLTGGQS